MATLDLWYTVLLVLMTGVSTQYSTCLENCLQDTKTSLICSSQVCKYGCKTGWYGARCTRPCSQLCIGTSYDQPSGRCNIGCKRLWMKLLHYRFCTGIRGRRATNDRCISYDDKGDCTCCKSGYRGRDCDECKHCRTIPHSGTCMYMCEGGFYGSACENACPDTCEVGNTGKPICKKVGNSFECSNGCIKGRYGPQCDNMCSNKCKNGCYKFGGQCVDCYDNYFGPKCEEMCSSNCLGGCHRNGSCVDGCKQGYVGSNCNIRCLATCAECNTTRNPETCFVECKEDCPIEVCYPNGSCSYMCSWENIGTENSVLCSNPKQTIGDGEIREGASPLVIGLPIGAVVVLVVLVAIFIIYKRKRKSKRNYSTKNAIAKSYKDPERSEETRSLHIVCEGERVERVKSFRRFQNYFVNIWRQNANQEILELEDMLEVGRTLHPAILIFTTLTLEKEAVDIMIDRKKHYSIKGVAGAITTGEIGSQKIVSIQLSSKRKVQGEIKNLTTSCLDSFKNVNHVLLVGVCTAALNTKEVIRLGDVVASDRSTAYYQRSETGNQKTPQDDTLQNILNDLVSSSADNTQDPPWKQHVEMGQRSSLKFLRPYVEYGKSDIIDRMYIDDLPRLHCGTFGSESAYETRLAEHDDKDQTVTAFVEGLDHVLESVTGSSFMLVRGVSDYQNETAESNWDAFAAMAAASVVKTIIQRLDSEQECIDM